MKDPKDQYQKIGIICWGLLGDVLMRTPVVHAIRQIFPDAKIIVIVDAIGEEIFRHNPDVDEIYLFDRKRKPKWKFITNKIFGMLKIRNYGFDLLIDLYSSRTSAKLLSLSNAVHRIGFTHSHVSKWAYNLTMKDEFKPASTDHLSRTLLKVVTVFLHDVEKYSIRPIFSVRKGVEESMVEYIKKFGLKKSYVLNLGSGGTEKIIAMEKTFEQVKFLQESYGYAPLIVCNPGQEWLQKQFVNDFIIPEKILHGTLDMLALEEIAAVIKLSDFIVTPDTGLYHIAVAVGTPLFGLFTCTSLSEVKPEEGLFIQCHQPDMNDVNADALLEYTAKFMSQVKEQIL